MCKFFYKKPQQNSTITSPVNVSSGFNPALTGILSPLNRAKVRLDKKDPQEESHAKQTAIQEKRRFLDG